MVHTIINLGQDNVIGKGQGDVLTKPPAALRLEAAQARPQSLGSKRIQLLRERVKK